MPVDNVGLIICFMGTLNFMVTQTFFFLGVNRSGPGTSSTSNHIFYRALGHLYGPLCKQPLSLLPTRGSLPQMTSNVGLIWSL
jgi:hypothetical protein